MGTVTRAWGLPVALLLWAAVAGAQGGRPTYYVAPGGSDTWSGTLAAPNAGRTDGPFATPERARDAIREARRAGKLPPGAVLVELRAGRYERTVPFELAAADSGSVGAPVVYRGQPGRQVRLSGGRYVNGWRPAAGAALERLAPEARGHVWQADLGALGLTSYGDYGRDPGARLHHRLANVDGQGEYITGSVPPTPGGPPAERLEVFCDGQPMPIARGPNEGEPGLEITAMLGPTIRDVRGTRSCVEGIFRYGGDYPRRWAGEPDAWVCGTWCRDWGEQRHRVKTLDPEQRLLAVEPPYHSYGYRTGQRFYGFNILAELDQPGEWYVDRTAGLLYFWPPQPLKPNSVEVSVAPALLSVSAATDLAFQGLVFEAARGTALTIDKGERCRVVGCTFRNLGVDAVAITDGRENGVSGCDIYGTGGGGIYLLGGDRKTLTPAGHYAENNHLHHYARWDRMYRPAVAFSGVGLRASHNLIHDAPHAAIIFAGNDHVIEYNEIHSVCRASNDCGAIYAGRDWTMRGHLIRYNYLHHLFGGGGLACRGIYLDDLFASAEVYGNLFHQVTWPIFLGGGRDNRIENNVFVDCPGAIHVDDRGLNWAGPFGDRLLAEANEKGTIRGMRFAEPPYSIRYPRLASLLAEEPKSPRGNLVGRNIFWPGKGEDLRRAARGAAVKDNWWDDITPKIRSLVQVEDNLVNVDPRFVNEARGDFRLQADSPAFALGFRRLPLEQIGLRHDAERASWPAVHTPCPMPAPLPQ